MPFINGKQVSMEELAQRDAGQPSEQPASEPGWFEPGSKSEAATRGAINAATLGLGKYAAAPINVGIDALTGNLDPKKSVWQSIKDQVGGEQTADVQAQQANPGSYLAGGLAGGAATGAAGVGKTLAGTIGRNAAMGGIQGAAQSGGDLGEAAKGAAIGAAIPAGIAGVGKAASAIKSAVTPSAGQVDDRIIQLAGQLKSQPIRPSNPVQAAGWEQLQEANPSVIVQTLTEKGSSPSLMKSLMQGQSGNMPKYTAQFNAVKDAIINQASSRSTAKDITDIGMTGLKGGAYGGLGEVAASAMGIPPGVTSVVSGVGGLATKGLQILKDRNLDKGVVEALSPAAQAGQSKIAGVLQSMGKGAVSDPAQGAARFATISTFLNQTDPEARAALNPDNPLNDEK